MENKNKSSKMSEKKQNKLPDPVEEGDGYKIIKQICIYHVPHIPYNKDLNK